MSSYEDVVRQCKRDTTLFEDPDFPAENSSLFFSRDPPRPFVWKRPKDIIRDPQYIVGGASRFDIQQGMLGDCWLLSAISSLTLNVGLLNRVICPSDGGFDSPDYCGVFRFNIWREGVWTEVLVDDRLPTYNGKLVFMHSAEKNEFWSPLLEKAFAKLNGSYESLKGGQTIEGMCDFTGGVSESYCLGEKTPENLFKIMLKGFNRMSLMGCSIEAKPNEIESKGSNGLVKGHAYTITAVRKINCRTRQGEMDEEMVRVRNPWGNEREWTGAWSDGSSEWSMVSESEKRSMDLSYDDDGEFWMTFNDFKNNFTKIEICNLGPDALKDQSRRSYESVQEQGAWVRGVSAGGCRNFINTFASNPQYRMNLIDADDDDDKCSVVIAVMQTGRRKLKRMGVPFLTIGYSIYEVPEENRKSTTPLDKEFFMYNASTARSAEFNNSREVSCRFQLPPGEYVVIPTTFDPNQDGKFLVRIFSEKAHRVMPREETTRIDRDVRNAACRDKDAKMDDKYYELFLKIAKTDEEIDAFELNQLLSKAFKAEMKGQELGMDITRALIALGDKDFTGKLKYEEFREIWSLIRLWKHIFASYDHDDSDSMDTLELGPALKKLGYSVASPILSTITLRFNNQAGTLDFKGFIQVVCRITEIFDWMEAETMGYQKMNLEDMMKHCVRF